MRGEETLIDARLTPVSIWLPLSFTGRVESRYGSGMPLNSLSNGQRGYMRLGRKTPLCLVIFVRARSKIDVVEATF